MKIRILSDLHLEFNNFNYKYIGEDVLLLAGDISNGSVYGRRYLHEFINELPDDIIKLFVPGNHEFYNAMSFQSTLETLREIEKSKKLFRVLINDAFGYVDFTDKDNPQSYSFFGGTMFTDCTDTIVERSISDFRLIYKEIENLRERWTLEDHRNQYILFNKNFDSWIERNEYFSETRKVIAKKICISHFLPSWNSIHPKYSGQTLNGYFASHNDARIEMVDLWVHGHTHSSINYNIGSSRVICNPRGYSDLENPLFDPNLIVEI
jgi:calcineurin-like phosphoesterase family protein